MAIDEERLEAFIEQFVGDVGAARRATTVVIGHELGLYQVLADVGPAGTATIAAAAGCDARLMQEWLDAQHVAGYCEHSSQTDTYWLSPEQAAVLADRSSPAFLVGAMTLALSTDTNPPKQQKEHDMPGIEVNDFSAPDEVRSPERTTVELVKVGDGEIGRYTFQPGWKWSECIKPVVGTDTCQVEHIGYLVSGALRAEHEDGTVLEIRPGSVYRIAPGHDASVISDDPAVVVEFQGAATYAKA